MKYFIQINQIVLSEYKSLDVKDAAILDYLRAWCQADDKKIRQLSIKEEGIEYRYTWINFKHLLKEMPLLKIKNKTSIGERISKLEKIGFIKTFRAPDRSLYIRLTEKIKELEFKEKRGVSLNRQGVSLNLQQVSVKTDINNISIKHNNNNNIVGQADDREKEFNFDSYLKEMEKNKQRHIQIIALYWKYKGFIFQNRQQVQAALKRELRPAKMLVGYSDEEIIQVMDWLCRNVNFKWTLETVHKFIDENLNELEPINNNK